MVIKSQKNHISKGQDRMSRKHAIATFNEGPLHAALKDWYAWPDDECEVPLEGRQIDIVRGDLLVEIQTAGLASLKSKVKALVKNHRVRIVYPLAKETWIVRVDADDQRLGRRKSPKRGRVVDAFSELVSMPKLLVHPNLSLEILLIQEEQVRRHEAGRCRRRKGWVIVERRLLNVLARRVIESPRDLGELLPKTLATPFTTAQLAKELTISRDLARKMAYCLRKAGAVESQGKIGNARLYGRKY